MLYSLNPISVATDVFPICNVSDLSQICAGGCSVKFLLPALQLCRIIVKRKNEDPIVLSV